VPARFDDGKPVFNVIIVGAGQCGLATAFGLLCEKIANILILESQPAGQEGPWKTYARMRYLRTHKEMMEGTSRVKLWSRGGGSHSLISVRLCAFHGPTGIWIAPAFATVVVPAPCG
jgi:2-polyprenyl-6-methoxyphenol hydroxylase-like FAD-dependent oxidoreductase